MAAIRRRVPLMKCRVGTSSITALPRVRTGSCGHRAATRPRGEGVGCGLVTWWLGPSRGDMGLAPAATRRALEGACPDGPRPALRTPTRVHVLHGAAAAKSGENRRGCKLAKSVEAPVRAEPLSVGAAGYWTSLYAASAREAPVTAEPRRTGAAVAPCKGLTAAAFSPSLPLSLSLSLSLSLLCVCVCMAA